MAWPGVGLDAVTFALSPSGAAPCDGLGYPIAIERQIPDTSANAKRRLLGFMLMRRDIDA
jgi:hypothetical protein